MLYIITIIIAYLLGSIPTAVWVGKARYGVDVREHGSKNAGATNTFRVLGKKPGSVVLLIDIIKGVIAVSIPVLLEFVGAIRIKEAVLIQIQICAAMSAVIGHIFPLFAHFKGGKGVATSLGVVIGLHPLAALCSLIIFFGVFVASKYVSLGAMSAAISFPIFVALVFKSESLALIIFSLFLALAVILAHRKNIRRLLDGKENKMNLFGK